MVQDSCVDLRLSPSNSLKLLHSLSLLLLLILVVLHRVSKNVPPLACYNFNVRERILIFFGRSVTDKASNQKTPQITSASALPGKRGKHRNCIFHSNVCISAFPDLNQSLLDFFNLFDSRLILALLYDSFSLVINAFSSGILGAWFRRKKSRALQQLYCVVARTMHQCAVFELFHKVMLKH